MSERDPGVSGDRRPDDDAAPEARVVRVTARADGPLVVDGPVVLAAPDGTETIADRLFLCRCGRSDDKPRCDGSHKRAGFRADGVVPARKP